MEFSISSICVHSATQQLAGKIRQMDRKTAELRAALTDALDRIAVLERAGEASVPWEDVKKRLDLG